MQMKREMQNGCLIRQANSGYELAIKRKIKKERRMVEEKRKKRKQQQMTDTFLKERWGRWQQHCGAADAHELPHTKKDWAVSLNIETTPLTHTS